MELLLTAYSCDPNAHARPRGVRWTTIRYCAKMLTKMRMVKSDGLVKHIAKGLGTTALHYGARRGDLEIVELLLSKGADPSRKNSLGMDATSMCCAFPELSGLLAKEQRKKEIRARTSSIPLSLSIHTFLSSRCPVTFKFLILHIR